MRTLATVAWLFALACAGPAPPTSTDKEQLAVVQVPVTPQEMGPFTAYTALLADTASPEKQMAFFHAFPVDFDHLKAAFGYEEVTEDSVIFGTHYDQGDAMIKAFFGLTAIAPGDLAAKAVGIARNGSWQADGVSYFRAGLARGLENTPVVFLGKVKALSGQDQIGFWKFYLDGPEPMPKETASRLRAILEKEPRQLAIVDSLLVLPRDQD